MIVEMLVTGMFQENCYLVGCGETREAMVVDPGDDAADILKAIDRLELQPRLIVITHEHMDHIGAITPLREASQAQLAMHPLAYEGVAEQARTALAWLGRPLPPLAEPDIFLEDGQELTVGNLRFQAIYCPGHTPGHMVYFGEGALFSGDVLFNLSIGRFDLPGGDGRLLLKNIREKVLTLPEETVVYPGHGPQTTIGTEKERNPFLRYPRVYLGIDPEQ